MNRKSVKIISLIVTALLLMGCFGGVVYATITSLGDSDYNLVEDGKSDYIIAIPVDADTDLKTAASELVTMLEMSTGVKLESVNEDRLNGRTEKIISLGNTELFEGTGINLADYDIGNRGYVIKTIDSNLFIASNMSFGVLCGVYDMLTETIGYEAYADDEIVVDKLSTVPLLKFDAHFKPLIDNRQISYYELKNSYIYSARMKLTQQQTQWSAFAHTTITVYCPISPYAQTHPAWYGNSGNKQICYGLAIEQDDAAGEGKALFEHLVEQVYSCLTNSGGINKEYIMIGQEDNYITCTCEKCLRIMNEYGGPANGGFAAIQIELTNMIAEAVDKKLAEIGDTRTIQYGTFAYQTSRSAPAVWSDAEGKYVPSSDRFRMRDNTFVLYAPIEMDFSRPITDPANSGILSDLTKWSDILEYDNENNHVGEEGVNTSDNMMIWAYCIPRNMFIPYQNFGQYAEYYQAFAEHGAGYIYDQAYGKTGLAAFNAFKIYTQSKALYSNEYDHNELAYDFIHQYYDLGGEAMYEYYNYMISYYAYLQKNENLPGAVMTFIDTKNFWSVPVLTKIIEYIDQAIEDIEPLKESDPVRYETVYNRLMREKCFPMYIMFQLYENEMTQAEKVEYVLALEKYTKMFDMTFTYENVNNVEDNIATWKANAGL